MQNSKQSFVNPAFADIYNGITGAMPGLTFFGIIATYAITAMLTTYFIPLPLYLGIPAALAIQFGRFAVVFMDFLNPTGTRSPWPPIIATLATMVALSELAFSILDMEWATNKFWAVFLFGGMVICFGYILELQFIHKGAEAFGMVRRSRPQGAAALPDHRQAQTWRPTSTAPVQGIPFVFDFQTNDNGKHLDSDQD